MRKWILFCMFGVMLVLVFSLLDASFPTILLSVLGFSVGFLSADLISKK